TERACRLSRAAAGAKPRATEFEDIALRRSGVRATILEASGHREEERVAIVFITGSTDGLGRAAAESLLDDGHRVVLHARSADRVATIRKLSSRAAGIVIGDLLSAAETR